MNQSRRVEVEIVCLLYCKTVELDTNSNSEVCSTTLISWVCKYLPSSFMRHGRGVAGTLRANLHLNRSNHKFSLPGGSRSTYLSY